MRGEGTVQSWDLINFLTACAEYRHHCTDCTKSNKVDIHEFKNIDALSAEKSCCPFELLMRFSADQNECPSAPPGFPSVQVCTVFLTGVCLSLGTRQLDREN